MKFFSRMVVLMLCVLLLVPPQLLACVIFVDPCGEVIGVSPGLCIVVSSDGTAASLCVPAVGATVVLNGQSMPPMNAGTCSICVVTGKSSQADGGSADVDMEVVQARVVDATSGLPIGFETFEPDTALAAEWAAAFPEIDGVFHALSAPISGTIPSTSVNIELDVRIAAQAIERQFASNEQDVTAPIALLGAGGSTAISPVTPVDPAQIVPKPEILGSEGALIAQLLTGMQVAAGEYALGSLEPHQPFLEMSFTDGQASTQQTPRFADLGMGTPGSFGIPRLAGLDRDGFDLLQLSGAVSAARGMLVLGWDADYTPMRGGLLMPSSDLLLPFATDAEGRATFTTLALSEFGAAGSPIFAQGLVSDGRAPGGHAASNALSIVTQ